MKIVEYYFKGIDCPNCAAKVEAQLNKISNISEARVNFLSKKIIINYNEEEFELKELESIIKKYDRDVDVMIEAKGKDDALFRLVREIKFKTDYK